MKLKVLLGIGIALICVGLVAVLSGGEIGCGQIQTTVSKIDTKEEAIRVATKWAKTTDCHDLIANTTKITATCYGETGLWQVGYYSTAKLIEEITGTPRTITYLDVIVSMYMEDGVVKRCCYHVCGLPEDFSLSANYLDFLDRAYRAGESGCEDF